METIQSERVSTHVLPPEIARDDQGHPTVEGTKTLLLSIRDDVKKDLVLNNAFVVTENYMVVFNPSIVIDVGHVERWGSSPVAWGSVPYVSLPPPPALPPPALLPPIEPNNWRVRKDGVGLVEKRPWAHDSGSEDKCTKVRVTEIQPSGQQNENEYFYLSFVLFLTVLPALVAPRHQLFSVHHILVPFRPLRLGHARAAHVDARVHIGSDAPTPPLP